VVVITGASSGLGRATAYAFAERGASVVLAARRRDELEETANGCRERGGRALTVVTDVTRENEVNALAQAAVARYALIDAWINNAGVTLFARLGGAPFEEHRRVIETNLYGAMFGARAVLPVFERQGHGVLVNVGSILSKVGQPFVPSYVISKFALRGLTEALRAEIAHCRDIHVCSIFPYALDTPHFETGRNRLGKEVRAMPPMQPPERVAHAIVDLVERPRHEVHVPAVAQLGLLLHAVAPRTVERVLASSLARFHVGRPGPRVAGGLFEPPQTSGRVHGRRPPEVSLAGLLVWIARNFSRIVRPSDGRD
jgi:short-subunit dehydrogenase